MNNSELLKQKEEIKNEIIELLKEKEEIKNEIIELLKQKEEIKYDNNIVDIKEQLNIIFLSSFTFFFVFFITYSN